MSHVPEKQRLKNLAGANDEMVALELANKWGRPVTEEEVVQQRKETVSKVRASIEKAGHSMTEFSDDEVYELCMMLEEARMEESNES